MSTAMVDDYATVSTSMKKAESDRRALFLSDVLKLAHSPDGDKSQEAALKLWEFMNNLTDEELTELTLQTNVSGPLAHLLSKFLASRNSHVLLYTARTLKTMMREDATREGLNKAGLSKSIAVALSTLVKESESVATASSIDIQKELYAVVQSLLYDAHCALEYAAAGGLRTIGETLTRLFAEDAEKGIRRRTGDPELVIVVLAGACNAFSFCDTCLSNYIHEMRNWISPICEGILHSGISGQETAVYFAACCLANATRDPGLTHALRAANGAEALDRCRHSSNRTAEVTSTASARLQINSGPRGDLEKVWRFRWGGGKGLGGARTSELLGLLAFLFAVTTCAGIVVLFIFHNFRF